MPSGLLKPLICALFLIASAHLALAANISTVGNTSVKVAVDPATGAYALSTSAPAKPVFRARFAVEVDHRWIRSDQYPKHSLDGPAPFQDKLGNGRELVLHETGLAQAPDLICILRSYEIGGAHV